MQRSALSLVKLPDAYITPITNERTIQQVVVAVQSWLTSRALVVQTNNALTSTNGVCLTSDDWKELQLQLEQKCLPDVKRYRGKVLVEISTELEFGGNYYQRWLMSKQQFAQLMLTEDIYLGDINGMDSQVQMDFSEFKCETYDDPYTIAAIVQTMGPGEEPGWVQGALSSYSRCTRSAPATEDSAKIESYIKAQKRKRAPVKDRVYASDEDDSSEDEKEEEEEEQPEQEAQISGSDEDADQPMTRKRVKCEGGSNDNVAHQS